MLTPIGYIGVQTHAALTLDNEPKTIILGVINKQAIKKANS